MANKPLEVMCGLDMSYNETVWNISTENVKKFLMQEFSLIEDELKKRGEQNVPHIVPDVGAIQIGKGLYPLVVILPETVLKQTVYSDNVPSVFRIKDDDDHVQMKPYYWKLLQYYMYREEWMRNIGSPKFKRDYAVGRRSDIDIIRRYCRPKIETTSSYRSSRNGGQRKHMSVVVLLDPGTVFQNMLTSKDRSDRPEIWINGVKKLVTENAYEYTMRRIVNIDEISDMSNDKLYQRLSAGVKKSSFNR